jgi:hypothetical protein
LSWRSFFARSTAWITEIAEPPLASIDETSENPPMRLAMSPDGGPSSVVTTPTTSRSPCGVMWTTFSAPGSTACTARSVDSETILPKMRSAVTTTKPMGCTGAVAPGGSTGRCTPRWPPLSRNARIEAKFPNAGL